MLEASISRYSQNNTPAPPPTSRICINISSAEIRWATSSISRYAPPAGFVTRSFSAQSRRATSGHSSVHSEGEQDSHILETKAQELPTLLQDEANGSGE